MIAIDDKLISNAVIEEQFICNLTACKGACCIAGESGAPLTLAETEILANIYPVVKPYLNAEGVAVIEQVGTHALNEKGNYMTPLVNGKACAYVCYSKSGVAQCGIQQAYYDNKVDFIKPISCHLYPIRVTAYSDFEAINYEKWEICKAACALGKANKTPVYQFLKAPLIRKYGHSFYEQLHAAAQYVKQNDTTKTAK